MCRSICRIILHSGACLVGAGYLLLTGCAQLPKNPDKPVSFRLPPVSEGVLVESSQEVLKDVDKTQSAFLLIPENVDALQWRLALLDHAATSIDLQVFIWSNDESGRLLMKRIMDAAERGVQVRLLVDDMPKGISDEATAMISRMENIQMRRFNPNRVRKGFISKILMMSAQFRQLNRRMHNKQLLVDGTWAVVGGRNIGNPYFGFSDKYNNRDLDVLITGEIVPSLADQFDVYWNADAAYPGEEMSGDMSEKKVQRTLDRFEEILYEDHEVLDPAGIPSQPINWTNRFQALPGKMVFGTAQGLQDSPKVKGDRGMRLVDQIDAAGIEIADQSRIITPYLIPSADQIDAIRVLVEEGRQVRILLPSMESNNHTMAHSHYKKYRKKLLRAGAELYEFRGYPSTELRQQSDASSEESDFISLHTKAFMLDDRWVLLGSLNLDPRSIHINTEHMLLIDSPELSRQMIEDFEWMVSPENAWQVTLNEEGNLRYESSEEIRVHQPARNLWQRVTDFFYRFLPIESQL